MAMLAGDYKRRLQSANKGALVGAGYVVDPVPVPPDGNAHEVAPAGSVVTVLSINATSTAGVNEYFKDANGTIQDIMTGATIARDYKQHFYCPWPVYVTTDVSVTVFVSPPSKGSTTA